MHRIKQMCLQNNGIRSGDIVDVKVAIKNSGLFSGNNFFYGEQR